MRFIYLAKNLLDGKCYVGQTKDFKERVRGHLKEAEIDKGFKFHAAIRKHGKENFIFEIIEECDDDLANEREKIWIERFDSFTRGYNLTTGGDCCFQFSEETIQKIREANSNSSDEQRYIKGSAFRGKHLSEEHKQKLREANKGKKPPPHSEETLRKMSESMKGKNVGPKSEEHRQKLSAAHKGKKLSEEHKAQLREYRASEETRRRLSEAGKGRVVSEETRRKMSESMKGKKFGSPSQETIEKRTAKTRGKKRTKEQKQRMRDGWARKREEKQRSLEAQSLQENSSS